MTSVARCTPSHLLRHSARSLRQSGDKCYAGRTKLGAPRHLSAVSTSSSNGTSSSFEETASDIPAVDISKSDLLRTSAAVKLASYVYKVGSVEPWVTRDGFVLRAQGNTECTRWFVCDELVDGGSGDDKNNDSVSQRWFIVRGAAWNDENVDSVKLSTQIARAWPSPLHPGIPVVCHAGIAEMTEEFWPEIEPWIVSLPPNATASFTGHSLGGSMATLLMTWARHRCGLCSTKIEPTHTFGSPPVIAADGWALRRKGSDEGLERVARQLAQGGDWVGELANAVGLQGAVRGLGGLGVARVPNGSTPTETASDSQCALRLAGFAPTSVKQFVLSNDPVPRMWLASDPMFGSMVRNNESLKSLLDAREYFFGQGMFTKNRFLYDAVGTLYWLKWTANDGTEITVHEHDDGDDEDQFEVDTFDSVESALDVSADAFESLDSDPNASADASTTRQKPKKMGHVNRLRLTPIWETDLSETLRGAFDHNAGNYVDAVQWLALKRIVKSKSVNL